MYEIVEIDPVLYRIGLSNDIVQNIVSESVFTGIPYVEACRKCREYYLCILVKILPVDIEQYAVRVSGITVVIDKNKPVDQTIEELMSRADTIKYYSGKVSFYIPLDCTIYIYNKLCRESGEKGFEIRTASEEDVLIYLGEESDNS